MRYSLKESIEIFGTIGVIASLIFVGYQLMLERRLAISTQYQNRAQLVVQYTQSGFENEAFVTDEASFWEGNRPSWWTDEVETLYSSGDVTMEGIVRVQRYYQLMMISLDNNYYQYRQGFSTKGFGNLI